MDLLKIKDPSFLKEMDTDELEHLAQDIRQFLIENCSKTGGHIGPNLGVVELTIALHKVFNSPEDKFLWDVGHQSYVHKILTGRADKFETLRKFKGLCGFPKKCESEHDVWEAGHSSTSISGAAGMAAARDVNGDNYHVLPIIGDGSMTGGMAFEALNQIGHEKRRVIVILNDNGMSIAPNVGAMHSMLGRIRASRKYNHIKGDIDSAINKVPMVGEAIVKTSQKVRGSVKNLVVPGMLFEELGFTYIGMVDGHNIEQIEANLEYAKKIDGPVLVHVITTKGKGYPHAESDKTGKWHGIGPYKLVTGEVIGGKSNAPSWSAVMSETVRNLARKDDKIVAITPAMAVGSKLEGFASEFPKRFFDVGIAEEHAATFAAGMALTGTKPYLTIYSSFLQRAYDQVLHDIARQKLNVVIGIDRAGLVGDDGETHQGVFDIAFLRHIPNMTIAMPKDENEGQNLINSAFNYGGTVAVRYPRGNGLGVKMDEKLSVIPYGTWEVLRAGTDICILTFGTTISMSLEAAEELSNQGISVKVVNARFIKPFDFEMLKEIFASKMPILTVEEAVLHGGFGSAVLEYAEEIGHRDTQISRMGIPDIFVEHGSVDLLMSELGLTKDGIISKILEIKK